MSAAMPMTTHVTGLASSAAVKLHTLDMSGPIAARAIPKPALSILNAVTAFVMTRPTPPTTAMTAPPTVSLISCPALILRSLLFLLP